MSNATATLVAHKGAQPIAREALAQLVTPRRTSTHTPIAHNDLIDMIEERLTDHGIEIAKLQLAVMSEGQKLFATMVLERATDDFALALGLRASNDKSMALEVVVGARVFVCDNMALSGESCALFRKHTGNLNVKAEVFGGMDRAIGQFADFQKGIKRLKETPISLNDGKALIIDALAAGVINQNQVLPVNNFFVNPPHEEHMAMNLWRLHNAFTQEFHSLRANVALEASQALGALLSI